ncbi:MAG: hypothetical protein K5770_09450 [Lachnospiraceae bacterium]|nr:hypothetical protein [Lachnospiraceae bacterium]
MIYGVSLLILLVFFVLAFIAGFTLRVVTKQRGHDLITIYSQGMVVILLIFILCSKLCVFISASVKFAGALWLSAIFIIEVFFIFADRRRFPLFFKNFRVRLRNREKTSFLTKLFATLLLILILLQICFVINFALNRPNAVKELSDAVFAYDTGRIVRESPMMMLYAWLAGLIRVHPLTVIYSVSPVILFPMYYSIEWSLARKLFKEDTDKCLFMLFVFSLLQIFGFQSGYMSQTVMLMSFFSGTAFFVHAVLPFTLWFVLEAIERKELVKERDRAQSKQEEALRALRPSSERAVFAAENINTEDLSIEEFEEDWDMKHRIVNSRNLGILLLVVTVMFAGTVFILNRKINSLHETAAGITENLNESVRTYEFIPEGSERAEALILNKSGGGIIVIGGGAAEYGDELYEMIEKYGPVKEWYLKGRGPEDCGAYEVCKERGIEAGNVYVLNLETVSE